jgi:hypothetical protein
LLTLASPTPCQEIIRVLRPISGTEVGIRSAQP